MANNLKQLLETLNQSDIDTWWNTTASSAIPNTAKADKYFYEKGDKRFPIKFVLESLAGMKGIQLKREELFSDFGTRAKLADKFKIQIIEELKYNNPEAANLKKYITALKNKDVLQSWLTHLNKIIKIVGIDPYHVRLSIKTNKVINAELGSRVFLSFHPSNTEKSEVWFMLPLLDAQKIQSNTDYIVQFKGSDLMTCTRFDIKNWSDIDEDILSLNIESVRKEYVFVKTSRLADIRRGSGNTNSAVKYLAFKNISIDEFISDDSSIENVIDDTIMEKPSQLNIPLNQILFGPPGTGKTYNTIDKAVNIIDGTNNSHQENKIRYSELIENGQIDFLTFHQSMSYEDFIEGIKPVTKDGNVTYEIKDGVFKRISKIATSNQNAVNKTNEILPFNEVIQLLQEKMYESENDEITIEMARQDYSFQLTEINDNSIPFKKLSGSSQHSLSLKTLEDFYLRKRETIKGLYPYYIPLRDYLWQLAGTEKDVKTEKKNFVLIIDEINRGNVSQIFGELITLIEEDKREGNRNEMSVTLPYSKEKFSVPSNLFIIGTMNTADRSVEALDTALRRRFSFVEMPPIYNLPELEMMVLNNKLSDLLFTINKRIEKLLGKDNLIGHAYFMDVHGEVDLKSVFQDKIIPLLQEYFFGDYSKIGLVLGRGFIELNENKTSREFFADFNHNSKDELLERPTWKIADVKVMSSYEFSRAINLLMINA